MDSCDDLFAFSDEEVSSPVQIVQANPVEDHLLKQLTDVQNRIDDATSEIADVKKTTAGILNTLQWRALYGKDPSSDSDSDLYTVEGEPITKKQKSYVQKQTSNVEKNLIIVSQWQCVLQDKWIIGVELQNKSSCQLIDPRYYSHVRDQLEMCGESMFWGLSGDQWRKIDSIYPGAVHVVAMMVLDLPTFDRQPVAECWGTISYEIDETQFQVATPAVRLTIAETIDISCIKLLDENHHGAILALKSTSATERTVNVLFSKEFHEDGKKQFFRFLATRAFLKVCNDVFLVQEHGTLMYCLAEVQSIDDGQASIRIFARSVNQLNIVLHLLQDEFPNMSVVEEVDNCVEAAMALIRELEMIRDKKSTLEIQKAKVITDLFIP